MKYLYISILMIAGGLVSAQSNRELINNFKKNEANIIYWQMVGETDLTRNELLDAIIESGNFTNIDVTGDKVVCELRPYRLNFEQYSTSGLEFVPAYISQNLITGIVIIKLEGNSYRCTIKNIRFIDNTAEEIGIVTPIEQLMLTRAQELKFSLFKNGSDLMNRDFTTKTTFKRSD